MTPFDVVVVTGEYDGFADFPDRPWNALAVANAMAGAIVVHVPVMYGGLDSVPAKNISVDVNAKGGTTTHYLVPTATLPLVQLNPRLKPREAELKAKIDAGYSRNDVVKTTTVSSFAATVTEEPAEEVTPTEAEPAPKVDAQARRDARAAARAEAKAQAAAGRQARADARAQAKAEAAAQREARTAARAGDDDSDSSDASE